MTAMKTKKQQRLLPAIVAGALFLIAGCSGGTNESSTSSPDSVMAMAKMTTGGDCSTDACGPCDNAARYPTSDPGGGAEVSPDKGKEFVTAFNAKNPSLLKGGFISKIALDSLFCYHKDYNGIYCYIGTDAAGKQVIVIEGRPAESNAENPVRVTFDPSITAEDRYKVFVTETLCPTMCGYCGD